MPRKNHRPTRPQAQRRTDGSAGHRTPPPPPVETMVTPTGVCPTRKLRFFPEAEAQAALRQAQAKRARLKASNGEQRYYACDICTGFHLTSRKEYLPRG